MSNIDREPDDSNIVPDTTPEPLSAEHHILLEVLRDTRLTTRERTAVETLLTACVGKQRSINAAAMQNRLDQIERGLQHLADFLVCGSGEKPIEEDGPSNPMVAGWFAHIQWLLDVAQGTHPDGDFLKTLGRFIAEHWNEEVQRRYAEAIKMRKVLVGDASGNECHNPACRLHRKWWQAS